MTDTSLRLKSLELSCAKERIRLLAVPSVTFQPQEERFLRMPADGLLDLMENRRVCITRGASCKLDFEFAFKKVQPDGITEEALIEELGRFVLEAPWWEQLPVSPSLKSPTPTFPGVEANFSLEIHDTLPNLHSNGSPGANVSPAADLHVPECVPDIRLVGIKFHFTFEPIQNRPPPVLTRKIATNDYMLFEGVHDSDLDPFEDIMELEALDSSTPRHKGLIGASSTLEGMPWEHDSFVEDQPYADAQDMLLYQTDHNSVPLPTPAASVAFSSQQEVSMLDSMETHTPNDITAEPSLKLATAKQFTDVALRTLLGGRQTKSTPNIKIGTPRPTRPLSSIMPLLWSPDFKNTISERCTFLNTISSTLTSLSKTGQLPSLHNKLTKIHENDPNRSAEGNPRRLNHSIQAHVFRMMQTALYEPIASRRLRPSVVDESGGEEARSGPPSRDYENSGPPQVGIRTGSDGVVDGDEGFDDMFGEELLSDGEMDMLFDLEIMRQKERGAGEESCSMLFGSDGRSSSMLMRGEERHEDATGEAGEKDIVFSTDEIEQDDGDEHILDESLFLSSGITDGVEEDVEMIMDTKPDMVDGCSSMYLDDPYVNNEAILI
ncbi:hypothetical protein V490_02560 [Pseudogymnoascus sp. VKM F-3557]|nr:hypothetical protein V490_02560 [Pseudogymnoascus sp. VKM F-3557]